MRGVQWNQTHRAVEDHTVAVAHTFDVGGEVEADGSVANGVHGLGIKEVVRPRWRKITDSDKNKHSPIVVPGFKKKKIWRKSHVVRRCK